MAELILVPTPIGNLEDITLRSIRMLKEADFVFAEDTRVTRRLLNHLEIEQQLLAFHAHNEHKILASAVEKIKTARQVVLVSDAGTPGVSDPGFLLVRACLEAGIQVTCLPGPAALIPALVGSGFPCDRFCFEGFLPHKKGRQSRLKALAEEERTVVLYESPHRLVKCLAQIEEFFDPEREVCVCRELSKMHEEYRRGPVSEVKKHYEEHAPKGEIVVVIQGKTK
ncbi:MAG: 16S rRNA (cytidine(1402)-2'-O)-methyltransferase [Bacteroidetes bacterium]|nr:MAG: 16S rRNA (cytidine(1402)-2'-O)-methyltransferase [Bacteroidota bacterium]